MSNIAALEEFFDKAKDFTVRAAQERDEERARNADLEALLRATEEERDRERRDRLALTKEYSDLEERARRLERDNAVLHSRGDQIVAIWKSDGERIIGNSDLRPEQILHPRTAADDQLEQDFAEIGQRLARNRGGYVEQLDKSVSHTAERSGLAEAASNSTESKAESL